ncbi:ATP-binding protein [Gemmobacter lanyuensis]
MAGPAPDAGRVFDKFYRDPHVLATSGSGLGLFIVRQVAKALGGSARFQIEDDFAILTLDLPDLTGTPSDLAVPRLQRVSG